MNILDASRFCYGKLTDSQMLEEILQNIYICYQKIHNELIKLANDENTIRDKFHELLTENQTQQEFNRFHIDTEVREQAKQHTKEGRVDFRFLPVSPYLGPEVYYIVECKRIDGSSKLNTKYVEEGVDRFVSEKYSSYCNCNAMLSFVIQSINIDNNVNKINVIINSKYSMNIMNNAQMQKELFIENYDYTYKSIHITDNSQKNITLYHLWLDVSKNILLD